MSRLLLFIIMLPNISLANRWDDLRFSNLKAGTNYSISIGSGFYVNEENIITNRHVVENCHNIAVRGAVKPTLVQLVLVDKELDLALLKSPNPSNRVPYLRNNHDAIKAGDILFSIGYPLETGETGEYIIKEAKVLATKEDHNKLTHIEFTDNVNNGNSGGPLLDKNSNLVGVVTAKLTYTYNDPSIPSKEVALAIGVEGLITFLKKAGVTYASSSTYDIFTNYHVDRLTKDYVVNIHCVHNVN
jgi:S1-C subfamily serine protease